MSYSWTDSKIRSVVVKQSSQPQPPSQPPKRQPPSQPPKKQPPSQPPQPEQPPSQPPKVSTTMLLTAAAIAAIVGVGIASVGKGGK